MKASRPIADASLIFDDEGIAAYLAKVYDYDWNTLANRPSDQGAPARSPRKARRPPQGFKRERFSTVFDDEGRLRAAAGVRSGRQLPEGWRRTTIDRRPRRCPRSNST